MKKLVFMFVAMAAMTMVSCGNKANEGAAQDTLNADTDSVAMNDTDTVNAPADTTTQAQ